MVAQEQPQLILVADDDKLLELAKKSKIQFDDQEGDASGIGSAVGIVDLLLGLDLNYYGRKTRSD